jgi:two-component system nitrate/nitrite response regulator NarL
MEREAILIIDDHALFRSGLAAVLSTAFASIALVDVGSLDEALALHVTLPTVILLDIELSNADGLEGMGSIQRRWPAARIVVVSAHDMPVTVHAALAQGAVAFISKADRPERMIAVLREVLVHDSKRPSLTTRQTEVLALVERGLSNKMIGRRLGLSEHTVRGHVQALLSGLGVAGRAEAAFKARQLGLIR